MERLSKDVDPYAAPRPVKGTPEWLGVIGGVSVIGILAGGAFLSFVATRAHTCGATRSAQLQWEQRQAEIEEAVIGAPAPCAPGAEKGGAL